MARQALSDLRRLPVFSALSRRALERVDSLLTPITFADGDVLCHEGRLGREAFVILSGEVEVSRADTHLATLGAGSVVGELALLGHGPRTATVTASGQVRALVMNAQEFATLLSEPAVSDEVHRVAAERSLALTAA
jgi:CRP-like cAMP-binding protein